MNARDKRDDEPLDAALLEPVEAAMPPPPPRVWPQPGLFDAEPAAPAAEPADRKSGVLVGTCSWSDPSLIQCKRFYPRGHGSAEGRLRYYASQFPIVEVDSSFFAMPQASNSALWVARTPADFVFNVKAFRLLTGHQTPPQALPCDIAAALPPLRAGKKNYYYADLPDELLDELWRRFIEALAPLRNAGKLRAAHFQFAPWVSDTPAWRAHVEHCVSRMAGHLLAVEFRNSSWLAEDRAPATLAWERGLGVAHVVVDEPQGVANYAQAVWQVTNPRLAVVRLHGRNTETWDAKGLAASSERFNLKFRRAKCEFPL